MTGRSVYPSVTVIIPAHNEAHAIGRCVQSVRLLEWPATKIEILVVDHASTDGTGARAVSEGAKVVPKLGGNIGAVRNAGLLAAGGKYVAYVDADCTVPRTWLKSGIRLLEDHPEIGAVGGPCVCPKPSSWVEHTFAPYKSLKGVREVESLATSSFITRSSLLRDLGLFSEDLTSGEDDEMSCRIRASGLLLLSSPECHVVHYGYARTLGDIVRKEYWHGSSQLESRSGLDATLFLTHLFSIFSLALPVFVAIYCFRATPRSLAWLLIACSLGMMPALLFAGKQFMSRRREVHLIVAWIIVGWAYFVGRSLGLTANYWRRLRAASKCGAGVRRQPL